MILSKSTIREGRILPPLSNNKILVIWVDYPDWWQLWQMSLVLPVWSSGNGLSPPFWWHIKQSSRPSSVCGITGTETVGAVLSDISWQDRQTSLVRSVWSDGNGLSPPSTWHCKQSSRPTRLWGISDGVSTSLSSSPSSFSVSGFSFKGRSL